MKVDLCPSCPDYVNPMEQKAEITTYDNTRSKISKKADLCELELLSKGLETISTIPSTAIKVYTDGSTLEDGSSGSGIYIEHPDRTKEHISINNTQYTSNYHAELYAIKHAIDHLCDTNDDNIWILER